MKFLFLLIICMNQLLILKFTHARRSIFKRKDNSCCADAVSRIASDLAAKAACEARCDDCGRCGYLSHKACLAKQELADKTVEAARLAQSSLASKLALVNELTEEKETVKCVLRELLLSKTQLERAINKEIEALAAATTLQEVLTKALQIASEVAVSSDMVLSGVKNNIQAMNRILQLENQQCHILCEKEHCARADVEATKVAEKNAVQAAMEARKNVLKIKRELNVEDLEYV